MAKASIQQTTKGLTVSGVVDFDSVMPLMKQLEIVSWPRELVVDFANLEKSNSAGLALMTGVMRLAKRSDTKVYFENIPESLWHLATFSDLDDIIPHL